MSGQSPRIAEQGLGTEDQWLGNTPSDASHAAKFKAPELVDQFIGVARELYQVDFVKEGGKLVHQKKWTDDMEYDDTPDNVARPIAALRQALAERGFVVDPRKPTVKVDGKWEHTEILAIDVVDLEKSGTMQKIVDAAKAHFRKQHETAKSMFGEDYLTTGLPRRAGG